MEIGGTRQIFPPGGAAAMPMVIGGSAEYELNHLGHGNSSLARHRSLQKGRGFDGFDLYQ